MTYLELLGGLIYLLMGGDLLVRGAVALARRTRVAPGVIALAVVGFGTSVPELVVSVRASLAGYPGLILGNVVGSNTANVLLIAGLAAVVRPLSQEEDSMRRNVAIMVSAGVGFALMCVLGDLTRVSGFLLLGGFVVVIASTAHSTVREHRSRDAGTPLDWALGLPSRTGMTLLFIGLGAVMLPLGAGLLVESAVEIAESLGVSNTVVGLSVVAIGTSLPELSTTLLAGLQGRGDVALATIVGSNTFNLLAIMGVTAALSSSPITTSPRFLALDLPVMLASSLVLATFLWRRRPMGRRTGVVCALAYVTYLATLATLA